MTNREILVRRRGRLWLALAAIAVAAGCSVNLPTGGPAPELFVLTPKSTFAENLPRADYQLVVELPVAAASLDTTRVAVMKTRTNLDYFANANWIDRAPQMIQTLIIESFENSDKIVAVGRESVGLRSDFNLRIGLREFQAEIYDASNPVVRVRINAKLVQMPQRTIVGNATFERALPIPVGASTSAIVEVWDEALGKCLKGLVEWTLKTADQARS